MTDEKSRMPELIKQLKDENPYIRRDAAGWLGEMVEDTSPAVTALIETLGDKNGEVRYYAARTLGQTGDLRALRPLAKRLWDKAAYVREAAAEGLKQLDTPEAERMPHKPLSKFLRFILSRN